MISAANKFPRRAVEGQGGGGGRESGARRGGTIEMPGPRWGGGELSGGDRVNFGRVRRYKCARYTRDELLVLSGATTLLLHPRCGFTPEAFLCRVNRPTAALKAHPCARCANVPATGFLHSRSSWFSLSLSLFLSLSLSFSIRRVISSRCPIIPRARYRWGG